MKRLLLYILFLFTAVSFFSCEQPVEEEQIPYLPKLVIRGFIKEGIGVKDIYIGRTLPVSVQYSSTFANLADAAAVIIYNDLIYPLKHYGNGLYKNDTLRIVKGEKYYFLANWQDLSVKAETVVPHLGNVSGVQIKTDNSTGKKVSYLEAIVAPFSDEVYCSTWALLLNSGAVDVEADSFATVAYKPVNGLMTLKSSEIPQSYLNNNPSMGMKVYYFDHAYAEFFNTQGSNKVSDAIFGQTGSKVKWNIIGDGIGLFIAKQDTLIKFR